MLLVASELRLAPSDLSGFLDCRHRTGLDLAVAHGRLSKPAWNDPVAQSLRDRGAAHEQAYVQSLVDQHLRIVEIDTTQASAARIEETLAAMRGGAEVIVQAVLSSRAAWRDGDDLSTKATVASHPWWFGYADVLRRVSTPSLLGDWSYEPCDTKLARETRGGTVLQLAVYVDLLEQIQGVRPEQFYVVTPGDDTVPFMVSGYRDADIAAYVRAVRRQLADTLSAGDDAIRAAIYPEPVEHCDVCRWWDRCNERRRKDDHLSFIAGIARVHRDELTVQGVATLAAAAAMATPIGFKPARGSRDSYARIREQARVQHEQRTTRRPVHELLLPIVEGQGLARLPEPSPADVFLDLEGARFAREGGREYLFGIWGRPEGDTSAPPGYESSWAFTDADERVAFEAAVDRCMRALAAHPGAHIYHFGHYEPSTFKRLMGRYATRGEPLDQLLRGKRFVDLHTVVRQALRAGVESYSIKQLEQFYGFVRALPLHDASAHLQSIELALEANASTAIPDEARAAVQTYNQDDCRSTEALRDWLERLRAELESSGTPVLRPVARDGSSTERVSDMEARQEAARAKLLDGLPPEAATDPHHPQHAYWLLAYLIDWHRREDKSQYWERFRLAEMPDLGLLDERQAIAGLELVERVDVVRNIKTGKPTGSVVDRYRYPVQEVELGGRGDLEMSGGGAIGELVAHDRVARTVDIRKGPMRADVHPTAVYTCTVIPTNVQQEAMLRFSASAVATTCGTDLLFRRKPRLRSGDFAAAANEAAADVAVRLALELDRTTLAIQGPPGAGKTYVGARMIRTLVRAGKRVGITAVSHKVIRNLLDAVLEQDAEARAVALKAGGAISIAPVRVGHRRGREDEAEADCAVRGFIGSGKEGDFEALSALASRDVSVLGGTSFLWARDEARATVDVLFVDEAGQMSLANALAVSGAAGSLVLLGDPQQLEQPQKGSHPDGVGVSALEHVLGGAALMPPDRGIFLPTTWRLHPSICAFTSELFYEGKLQSRPGLERQRLVGAGIFDGAGLWWLPVEHAGNQNASMEEVDAVERIVRELLAPNARWEDEKGVSHPLTPADLRIVAPYNAQVNRLTERLAASGVPIGTVDKFQGQEAPVVIYSLATSRPEDAPRGMEFLYSLNRLNVATSRARCVAIIVGSPRLLEPACRTPRQMRLANAFCRYLEMASPVEANAGARPPTDRLAADGDAPRSAE